MTKQKVAVVVGSLRRDSITRKVAKAMVAAAPPSLECSFAEIGDLPLYNQDLDGQPPAAWTRFRQEVKQCAGILFLTPEYNRSLPGGLKNAIDVGSRPQGQSVFDGLPAAVVSVTPYQLGAFGANHALRQAFVFLNMPALQQPEAYIGNAESLFDAQGGLKKDETREFFAKFMAAFSHWVEVAGRMKQK
jgi:chromate reductase